jgi:hypothetical protein
MYRVKWKDWDEPTDITWEPLANLLNVQDLIDAYD